MAKDKSGDNTPDLKIVPTTDGESDQEQEQEQVAAPAAEAEAPAADAPVEPAAPAQDGPTIADLQEKIERLTALLATVQAHQGVAHEQTQPTTADAPASEATDEAWHAVQPGESWESIAALHGLAIEAIHALNAHLPHFSDRSTQVGTRVRVQPE